MSTFRDVTKGGNKRRAKKMQIKSNENENMEHRSVPLAQHFIRSSIWKYTTITVPKRTTRIRKWFCGQISVQRESKQRAQSDARPLTGKLYSELNQNVIQHRLFIVIHPYDALRSMLYIHPYLCILWMAKR